MRTRTYGQSGPTVVLVHGGPGAPGSMAPVARGLADAFRVIEPFQRGGGGEPLTVERHVEDLHDLMTSLGPHERPALVGWSWGAMLVLAYAAEHSGVARSLALIGCGTFDTTARGRMREILAERLGDDWRERIERLEDEIDDPDRRLDAMAEVLMPAYHFDPLPEDGEGSIPSDDRAHRETWEDMIRRQEAGDYPAAFAAIEEPVLMIHGDHDPHPGRMIRDGLRPLIPRLEYRELARCGHDPWRERYARDEFFDVLREWSSRV